MDAFTAAPVSNRATLEGSGSPMSQASSYYKAVRGSGSKISTGTRLRDKYCYPSPEKHITSLGRVAIRRFTAS
eukprot:3915911-Prymnesium_polylepis.1